MWKQLQGRPFVVAIHKAFVVALGKKKIKSKKKSGSIFAKRQFSAVFFFFLQESEFTRQSQKAQSRRAVPLCWQMDEKPSVATRKKKHKAPTSWGNTLDKMSSTMRSNSLSSVIYSFCWSCLWCLFTALFLCVFFCTKTPFPHLSLQLHFSLSLFHLLLFCVFKRCFTSSGSEFAWHASRPVCLARVLKAPCPHHAGSVLTPTFCTRERQVVGWESTPKEGSAALNQVWMIDMTGVVKNELPPFSISSQKSNLQQHFMSLRSEFAMTC